MYDVPVYTSPVTMDCGPTCLRMLLSYYGTEVDQETLNRECNVRIIGSTMADLMRVGAAHGMEPHVYEMDADELLTADRPAIIQWHFNHFVVFCGVDTDGTPIINNPDSGRYHVPVSSFKALYSGVAYFNGEPQEA